MDDLIQNQGMEQNIMMSNFYLNSKKNNSLSSSNLNDYHNVKDINNDQARKAPFFTENDKTSKQDKKPSGNLNFVHF